MKKKIWLLRKRKRIKPKKRRTILKALKKKKISLTNLKWIYRISMSRHKKLLQNINKISRSIRKRQKMNSRNYLLIKQEIYYKIKVRFFPLKASRQIKKLRIPLNHLIILRKPIISVLKKRERKTKFYRNPRRYQNCP